MHAVALMCSLRYLSAGCSVRCCFFSDLVKFREQYVLPDTTQSHIFPTKSNRLQVDSLKKKSRFESIRLKIRFFVNTAPYWCLARHEKPKKKKKKKQAPLSGWMAGTRYSTGWTYVYCAYYVMRLSLDLAYIILG